ncbi:MAG: dimethylsulfoxide reductase subunit B [Chloroflexi bacterium]|nr:dimethylsulfoxide reductase subunit B [Chloroflexota bacterium]
MAKQLSFYFDSSACVGCKTCQIACKDKNNLPLGVRWRRVFEYAGGSWVKQGDQWIPNNVFGYGVSLACNHCENPTCVSVCPTGAMFKRADGVVLINQDQCVGCRYCEWACPYGAPQFDEAKGVMTKCNLCEDLIAQGQNPACVDACPLRALAFGDLEELRNKYGNIAAVEPLPAATITQPHLVITPNRHAQASGKGTGKVLNLPEEL